MPLPPPHQVHLSVSSAFRDRVSRCDVCRDGDVQAAFAAAAQAIPLFCSVVNTAGVASRGLEEDDSWNRIMDINAGGAIR